MKKLKYNITSSYGLFLIITLLFFAVTPFLLAQTTAEITGENSFPRRIVWRGGEYAVQFLAEIERLQGENYRNHLRVFTTELHIDVSLPPGQYRFRITPYDILDRPSEESHWMFFEVQYAPQPRPGSRSAETDQFQIIDTRDFDQAGVHIAEPTRVTTVYDSALHFNSLGVSVGTTFIDPLVVATIHGTYAPLPNIFVELGCDFGFISKYDDVEKFYSIYPFIHLKICQTKHR